MIDVASQHCGHKRLSKPEAPQRLALREIAN